MTNDEGAPEVAELARVLASDAACPKSGDFGYTGRRYWRSLEELADTEEFRAWLHREFPREASLWDDRALDRRRFLHLMAASLALAGFAGGCSNQGEEKILPHVRAPEGNVPGKAMHYATAMPMGAGSLGLVVTSREGRPIKIEGNEVHPASLGATDAWAQASILSLYDPDRSQTVMHLGEISTWEAFLAELRGALEPRASAGGRGCLFSAKRFARRRSHGRCGHFKRSIPRRDGFNTSRSIATTRAKARGWRLGRMRQRCTTFRGPR
jgi:MoCo/4Fe-4S cofactor protein with predicted Tat translocation signal